MSASPKALSSPAQEIFVDELESEIQESLQDPEYRAAFEDASRRQHLIDTLVGLRKRFGLTQKQVAKQMGVKQPTISQLENEGDDPRLSTLQRYARAVNASLLISLQASVPTRARVDPYFRGDAALPTRAAHSEVTDLARAWAQSGSRYRLHVVQDAA